jgi:hypothetical protein
MNWKRSAPILALIGLLALWTGPAKAAPITTGATAAQTDSLVWYVEELEARLELAAVRGRAGQDSLRVRLDYVTQQLQWANEDRRRWYQDPRLWFLFGCASATLVMAGAIHVAF